jgi:hypothetical protein
MEMGGSGMNRGLRVALTLVVTLLAGGLLSLAMWAQEQPPAASAPAASQTPYQPKFRGDPAKSEAESLTLGYMRTVIRAEKIYMARRKEYAPTLLALGGHGSFTKRMARNTQRGDYTIHYRVKKDPKEGYQLTGTPQQIGPDHRSFYADEDGKIRVEEDKPAGPESPVLK